MQFGVFDHVERRNDVPLAQQFAERLDLVQLIEDAGFYCYHVAEHHNSPLCLAADQTAYLSAAAARTKTLRLATLVYVLPLHHPIRLIEAICILDQLSNGRFEVGVGRGTDRAQELRMWGGDDEENNDRFDETLDIVLKGLTNEFLNYEGRFYNFHELWMELKPMQQPQPPFWWPGSPVHCGKAGMNFVGGGAGLPAIKTAVDQYIAAYKKSPTQRRAGRDEPLYGTMKHFYIADTDDEARERTRSSYEWYRTHFIKPLPNGRIDPEEIPIPSRVDVETAMSNGSFVYGSPATIRDYVRRYGEETGANYLAGSFHWGDLTHKEATRSLELFASEVMPAAK